MAAFYRRMFFWIFVFLFLLTTPVAILYSQGYRFDQYKRIFIHSGSITVKSVPSDVNIFLNGELQSSGALDIINNSITVNGLRPGNYNLKVASDGYNDWEKNIEIHSGLSTEFWNIFLVPRNISPEELIADGVQRYFPSSSGKNIAYYKKNGDISEIRSLDIKSKKSDLLFSEGGYDFSSNPLENIEWNSKEKLFIAPVISGRGKDFVILDSEQGTQPVFLSQITDFSDLDNVRWHPDNENEIYFTARQKEESQNNLYRVDLETKTPQLILENILAYDLSSSVIFFLRQNNIIYEADLDGKNDSQLVFAPIIFSNTNPENKIRLITYDETRQAIISESGELYLHNRGESSGDTLKKISENSKGMQFSDDGKKLLYWSDNEINVLYLREWDVQPRRTENEIQQIIRFASPIKNVFWYRDYEHVLFSTLNLVKIIELDSRDGRIVEDIFGYKTNEFLSSYDSSSGIYYYIDEIDNVSKLFFFNIPEKTSFFGG